MLNRKMFLVAAVLLLSAIISSAEAATNVQINWTDMSNNEDGFRVQRCAAIAPATSCSNLAQVGGDLAANTQSAMDISPAPGRYCYRVDAFNSGGVGASGVACATVLPPIVAPNAPQQVTVTVVTVP